MWLSLIGLLIFLGILVIATIILNLMYPDKTAYPMVYTECKGAERTKQSKKSLENGARWPLCGRTRHDDWFIWPLTLVSRRLTWFQIPFPFKKWAGNAKDEWHFKQDGYPYVDGTKWRSVKSPFEPGKIKQFFGATAGAGLNEWIISGPTSWFIPSFISVQFKIPFLMRSIIMYAGLKPDMTLSPHRWNSRMDGPYLGTNGPRRPFDGNHAGDFGGYFPEFSLSFKRLGA